MGNVELRKKVKGPGRVFARAAPVTEPAAEVPHFVDTTAYFVMPEEDQPIEDGFYARCGPPPPLLYP